MFTGGLFVYFFVYDFEYGGLQSDAWLDWDSVEFGETLGGSGMTGL